MSQPKLEKLDSAESDVFEDALETLSLQSGGTSNGYVEVFLPNNAGAGATRGERFYGTTASESNLTAGLMTPHSFDFNQSTSSLRDALSEHVKREANSRQHSRTNSDASEWVIPDGLALSANEAIPNATDTDFRSLTEGAHNKQLVKSRAPTTSL